MFQSLTRLHFPVHVFLQDAGYHHGKTVFKGWVRGNKLPDIFREHPSRGHMTHVYASGQAPGKVTNTRNILSLAKPSQHFNATYRNIVGCTMLRAFGHPLATRCDMLGVVGSNLKMVKFFTQHLWMLHDVVAGFVEQCCPQACALVGFSLPNMSQHVATGWLNACCAQQCLDMLRSNVAIVWPGLYKPARQGLKSLICIRC